jgi:hypothetical protein
MDSPPLPPALPVDLQYDEAEIERLIELGPPASAEEYLLRVRCAGAIRNCAWLSGREAHYWLELCCV